MPESQKLWDGQWIVVKVIKRCIYIYIYARANPCPLCTAFRAQCNMSLVRNALTYTCSASIHNKMTKFFMLAIRLVKIVMLEREREREREICEF